MLLVPHAASLLAAGIALVSAIGVSIDTLRRRDLEPGQWRTTVLLPALSIGLCALGIGMAELTTHTSIGLVLSLAMACVMPLAWGWVGYRLLAEEGERGVWAAPIFAVASVGILALSAYLVWSRPVLSKGAWFVEPGERWVFFLMLLIGVWAMSYFERAFRWAAGRTRHSIRWFRFWLALFIAAWILAVGEGFLWLRMHAWWLALLVFFQSGALVTGMRFLRRRIEEDLHLTARREGTYRSAMAILFGLYLVFLGIIGMVIKWAGGDLETYISVLAAVFAVLLISGLLMMPTAGRGIRKIVDRYLYGSRLDFTAEWTRITDEISGILDLPTLVKTVAEFLEEAFSEQVDVFLPDSSGHTLTQYYPFGSECRATLAVDSRAADWLWRLGEPVAMETWISQAGNEADRSFLSEITESLNGQVVVPLLARRHFLGFAVLGPRRDRPEYDNDDFEFLAAMSNPVAFAIMTGQVSEELLARREMESFHRLSSFIIHDLKNSVSMLSMLLQNAERHINDPNFQTSALRTIREAVENMQKLIGKISAGASPTGSTRRPVDLNATVRDVAETIGLPSHEHVDYSFEAAPDAIVQADPMYVRRVIENLFVNALEAMEERGTLRTRTSLVTLGEETYVYWELEDTGCGMTQEFVSTRLFRPFSSTKKKGLGIGMYQVKEIVEADGGWISVESDPNAGTTFSVYWQSGMGDTHSTPKETRSKEHG